MTIHEQITDEELLEKLPCRKVHFGDYSNNFFVTMTTPWGKTIAADTCMATELALLWMNGIRTIEHCCGHCKTDGYIAVEENSIEKMKCLGYNQQKRGKEFFYPKSHSILILALREAVLSLNKS